MYNGDDNDNIQNLSGLKLLESLDLGHRKVRKEETKEDNFEDDIHKLLSKLNTQLNNVKNISNLNYKIEPFNIDINNNSLNSSIISKNDNKNDNSPPILKNKNNFISNNNINNSSNNNNINNSSNNNIYNSSNNNINNSSNNNNINNNSNNINNNSSNNNNTNNRQFLLQNSLNNQSNNNENNKNNFVFQTNTPYGKNNNYFIPNESNNINIGSQISEENNNHQNNNDNNNINNNNDDEFNIDDLEDIPEIGDENDNKNNNNQQKNNNFFNTNINKSGNFNLDINEIELSGQNLENNEDLLKEQLKKEEEEKKSKDTEKEEERKRKEEEEERKRREEEEEEKKRREEEEEEEKRKRKEAEEEEEERRKKEAEKEEEERKRREEEEEERKRKEEEEEEERKRKEEQNKIIKDSDKIESENENNNSKINLRNKNKNNDGEEKKEKDEKKQDDIIFDIEEIESVVTNKNLPAPESANVSGVIPTLRNTKNKTIEKNHESNISDNEKSSNKENKEKKKQKYIKEKDESKKEDIKEDMKDNQNIENKKPKFSSESRTYSMPTNQKKINNTSLKKPIKKTYTQKQDVTIKTTITKIENEDSHPDLSNIEDYVTLIDLVEDEKALDDIIPNYKEKIYDVEDKDIINAREYFLTKIKYIQDDIKEDEKISQSMDDIGISHYDLMKKIFKEKEIINIPKYEDELEKKIFEEELNDFNCPIGGVENLDSFIQKYLISEKLRDICKNFFSKWRRILGDGHSYYRILMFSIFEVYILTNNLVELKYILSEMTSDEFIEIYKEKEIDYETCFSIFSIILNLLQNKQNSKAYEILLKSYLLKDACFDKLLIAYLRKVVATYIGKLKEYLNNNDKYNDNRFNTYLIESTNIEPSFLILCITPYLFNVSMIILTLKGELLKPVQSQINFVDPEETDIPIIYFGFFFSSYYKLYSSDFESKYNYQLNLIENNNKQLTYIFKDLKVCHNCEMKTEHILFIEKKFIVCKNCLENHLSYACNFRAEEFKNSGFLGLEYYTRPIHLRDNYYIDDLEIIELLESLNIINALCQKYNNMICNQCREKSDEKNIFELKCGCTFCMDCLEAILLKMTNGIKYLLPIEKKEFESTKCMCGKTFDLENTLKHVKSNKNDIKDASNRLKGYINTLCLICKFDLREEDENSPNKYKDTKQRKYKIIKLKKNMKNERSNGIDYMEIEHLVCEYCHMKYFQGKSIKIENEEGEEEEEDNEIGNLKNNNSKIVDLEKGTIKCEICCVKHDLDPKFSSDGGCCTACNIF